jgi:hypothetical protein
MQKRDREEFDEQKYQKTRIAILLFCQELQSKRNITDKEIIFALENVVKVFE